MLLTNSIKMSIKNCPVSVLEIINNNIIAMNHYNKFKHCLNEINNIQYSIDNWEVDGDGYSYIQSNRGNIQYEYMISNDSNYNCVSYKRFKKDGSVNAFGLRNCVGMGDENDYNERKRVVSGNYNFIRWERMNKQCELQGHKIRGGEMYEFITHYIKINKIKIT